MLFNPLNDKTYNLMSKSLFFMGPIIIWYLIMFLNPSGFVDFINSGSHPDGFFAGIASGISTKAGVTAVWAHMVAGDIFVTKWIWRDGVKKNNNIWIIRFSVFFGVMLMPLGILIHLVFGKKK